jgi:hypothetical protein
MDVRLISEKGGSYMTKKTILLPAALFVVYSFAAFALAAPSDNGYSVLSDPQTGTVKPK